MSGFWQDRPTLVTGGTGLVGGWVVRRLLRAQADIVCLVRDWVPESEFERSGLVKQVKTVRGDVCDQALIERVCGEYEIDTVIHLAAQTLVPVANRNPVATFESNNSRVVSSVPQPSTTARALISRSLPEILST